MGSGLLVCGLIHFMSPLPHSLDFSEHKVWRLGAEGVLSRPSLGFLQIRGNWCWEDPASDSPSPQP